jgi:uncharacterized protein YdaU (DUF1376 family)
MTKAVPYFPLYAANLLALRPFRVMNLEQRGLWITIMMECWVNGSVPANQNDLSKLLGLDLETVKRTLIDLQSAFFEKRGDDLICCELEEYRQGYEERREKQREGGKKGAERKKSKLEESQNNPTQPKGQPKGSLNYINSNHISSNHIQSNQLLKKDVLDLDSKKWVEEYEQTPDINISYAKASRG